MLISVQIKTVTNKSFSLLKHSYTAEAQASNAKARLCC